jgi:uncharacterized membrane protein
MNEFDHSRPDLSGPDQTRAEPKRAEPGQFQPGPTPPPAATSGFDMNRPTIISLLYLASTVLGITALVGVVLAYVWKAEPQAEWETSHYQYLINTFWIFLVGMVVGAVLAIVLIGFAIMLAVFVLVVVRSILSLINAQKQQPMPNPATLLA